MDTPGAPAAIERVGVEMDTNGLGERAESGRMEEGEEVDGADLGAGQADSWEPRAVGGRDGGRAWERSGDRDRERGRDDSRGWNGDRDKERGRNRERRQPPLPPPPNGSAPPPPPPPPAAPIDPKIEEALNDTIARVMREADEAEARNKEGGVGEKEPKEPGIKVCLCVRLFEVLFCSSMIGDSSFGTLGGAPHSRRVSTPCHAIPWWRPSCF